jgi:hypothetical protein
MNRDYSFYKAHTGLYSLMLGRKRDRNLPAAGFITEIRIHGNHCKLTFAPVVKGRIFAQSTIRQRMEQENLANKRTLIAGFSIRVLFRPLFEYFLVHSKDFIRG